ncbi:hypothetical protein H8356DRAFT_449044 [Neocallimastix lanati (nom. inval.)]|jgi:hypothetical protein|uniref:RING-type domain-containing protein n=1 Tax=Neocallimastix californiae TaxID=1754190 RepID=A0A1Y2DMD7_9FUNG|nr:hypothetical protein H8356DRAFT_449044 [Neocallimastix sp. JGI-2020a]ORY60420.1 hypothetical protein LY90DRAFT_701219 [Neocallimastix californiae]|eukprot:ORY60420.1 hypothetical protein LY90DRAFT_701219 [Neocallimastix californiae]
MSNHNIDTDKIISLVNMKEEVSPGDNIDSEELLIKTTNKEKQKGPAHNDKPTLLKEKSLSFKLKSDASDSHNAHGVSSKEKNTSKLYKEPSSSDVGDLGMDQDNNSMVNSVITDTSDVKNHRQSATNSLRNKRFSYNSPNNNNNNGNNTHQWISGSTSNINSTGISNSSSSNAINSNNTNTNSIGNNNNNNNNNNSGNSHRPSFGNRTLSGSFAELINITTNAFANNSNTQSNNNNNGNNGPTTSSSRRGSLSSNIQQNFHRLGLSDNINIETVEPNSYNDNDNDSSQVGPGETAWLLFRIYAIIRFLWAFAFCIVYFINFIIRKNKSCDMKIFYFSIAFSALFFIHAISTILLIIYLPTSITRYTNVVRRRVVISTRAWKLTAYTFLGEIIMIIIGAILVFNKSQNCYNPDNETGYVTVTKVIVLIEISIFTVVMLPLFTIPCTCIFELLPEYRGISDKVLKRFNSILYNPSEEVDEDEAPSCSICMENYKPGTRIKRLPCNHEFHPECITQWLETNNSCPICRETFT